MRRQSQGFSRGTSTFRGVSPHPSGALLRAGCVAGEARDRYICVWDRSWGAVVHELHGALAALMASRAVYIYSAPRDPVCVELFAAVRVKPLARNARNALSSRCQRASACF